MRLCVLCTIICIHVCVCTVYYNPYLCVCVLFYHNLSLCVCVQVRVHGSPQAGVVYETLSVMKDSSSILRDMAFSLDRSYLYVLSETQVSERPPHDPHTTPKQPISTTCLKRRLVNDPHTTPKQPLSTTCPM